MSATLDQVKLSLAQIRTVCNWFIKPVLRLIAAVIKGIPRLVGYTVVRTKSLKRTKTFVGRVESVCYVPPKQWHIIRIKNDAGEVSDFVTTDGVISHQLFMYIQLKNLVYVSGETYNPDVSVAPTITHIGIQS